MAFKTVTIYWIQTMVPWLPQRNWASFFIHFWYLNTYTWDLNLCYKVIWASKISETPTLKLTLISIMASDSCAVWFLATGISYVLNSAWGSKSQSTHGSGEAIPMCYFYLLFPVFKKLHGISWCIQIISAWLPIYRLIVHAPAHRCKPLIPHWWEIISDKKQLRCLIISNTWHELTHQYQINGHLFNILPSPNRRVTENSWISVRPLPYWSDIDLWDSLLEGPQARWPW